MAAKPKRAPVGGTLFPLKDAEHAAGVLRAEGIPVEVKEVSCVICPGAVRKKGWMLFVPSDEVRTVCLILDEKGTL
ncbi:MAG: hypothetical protein LC745_00300 [Planctomycetia bacterium]|nr:hypothetical protein [Planctomycetia bacterium]